MGDNFEVLFACGKIDFLVSVKRHAADFVQRPLSACADKAVCGNSKSACAERDCVVRIGERQKLDFVIGEDIALFAFGDFFKSGGLPLVPFLNGAEFAGGEIAFGGVLGLEAALGAEEAVALASEGFKFAAFGAETEHFFKTNGKFLAAEGCALGFLALVSIFVKVAADKLVDFFGLHLAKLGC